MVLEAVVHTCFVEGRGSGADAFYCHARLVRNDIFQHFTNLVLVCGPHQSGEN